MPNQDRMILCEGWLGCALCCVWLVHSLAWMMQTMCISANQSADLSLLHFWCLKCCRCEAVE